MRQLKGKVKETSKQRKERKRDFVANKKQDFTIVLPALAIICFFIAAFIYIKTRPKAEDY